MSLSNDSGSGGGQVTELARTGFPYALVILFALAWIGVGWSVLALRRRATGGWDS